MPTKTALLAALLAARLSIICTAAAPAPPPPQVRLTDITERARITFRHVASPDKKYIVESMSGGVALIDYDADGLPDIFFVNSLTVDLVKSGGRTRSALYRNNGDGTFADVTDRAGVGDIGWGMGAAVGDYDNDGDLDLLVSNNGEAPLLLRNEGGNRNNWLGLQLAATKSSPSAVGALITWRVGGAKFSRLRTAGGSYLASHDPREILGAGRAGRIDSVEVRWPGGALDTITNPPMNTYVRIVEGAGLKGAAAAAK